MFKSNDKSFKIIRVIFNIAMIIALVACLIASIVVMANAFDRNRFNGIVFTLGICMFLLSPVVLAFVWLLVDRKFTTIVDIKLIRNASYGYRDDTLLNNFAPFFCKRKCRKTTDKYEEVLNKLVEYKKMVKEGVLSEEEFASIKAELIGKEEKTFSDDKNSFDTIIKLKKLCDAEVISKEEFANEKSKILSKK